MTKCFSRALLTLFSVGLFVSIGHSQTFVFGWAMSSAAVSGNGSLSTSVNPGYYASITAIGQTSWGLGSGASATETGNWVWTVSVSGYNGGIAPYMDLESSDTHEYSATRAQAGGRVGSGTASAGATSDFATSSASFPPVQPIQTDNGDDPYYDDIGLNITPIWNPTLLKWVGTAKVIVGSNVTINGFSSGEPEGSFETASNNIGDVLDATFMVGTTLYIIDLF
jgi:hypothetical protein